MSFASSTPSRAGTITSRSRTIPTASVIRHSSPVALAGYATALTAHKALDLIRCPGNRTIDAFVLLRAARDHFRHRALRIHLRCNGGRGRRAGDRRNEVLARRVIVQRTLGQPLLGPGLEIAQLCESRQIVALARGDELLDLRALRQEGQQALRGRLVPREFPDAPKIG